MIQLTKKKNSEKKVLSFDSINSKVLLSAYYAIASTPSASSKKATYFSSFFFTHEESNHHSPYHLLIRKMPLKEGFNTSLQHAFFDRGKEFYSKKHLIYPTKINRCPKMKIIFPILSTATNLTSYLDAESHQKCDIFEIILILVSLVCAINQFYLPSTTISADCFKEIVS